MSVIGEVLVKDAKDAKDAKDGLQELAEKLWASQGVHFQLKYRHPYLFGIQTVNVRLVEGLQYISRHKIDW